MTISEELEEYVEAVKDGMDEDSDAAAVRECVRRARDLEDRVGELEEQLEDVNADREVAEARIDELTKALRAANRRDEETTALARYVDENRSAGIVTRTRWWLFGRDE